MQQNGAAASERPFTGEVVNDMSLDAQPTPAARVDPIEAHRLFPESDPCEESDSLFEQVSWLYAFCREHLFRDDTETIINALWPDGAQPDGERVIELGCGPGFYACRLAKRFPKLHVLGADRCPRQLRRARERAAALGLANCQFNRVNVLEVVSEDNSFDALIASRLFTVLPQREAAVAEMFRVLRPGGRCFIAEPLRPFRASLPLAAMWLMARLFTTQQRDYREPRTAAVLQPSVFKRLMESQPWKSIRTWQDGRYQYALCEKG